MWSAAEVPVEIPLISVAYSSRIVDFISTTCVTLTFQSFCTESFKDVFFTYPVDPNAAVYALKVQVGVDYVIEGTIAEKSTAKNSFDNSIGQGHGAYLLSESAEESDLHKLSVGNIPPGSQVKITISYLSECILEDNSLGSIVRFTIPLGILKRYTTSQQLQSADASSSLSSGSLHVCIPIDITVNLTMTCDILSLTSTTPVALDIQMGHNQREYQVNAHTDSHVGEFALLISRVDNFKSTLLVADDGAQTTMTMLALHPNLSSSFKSDQLFEIAFVVDRSM